MASRVPLRSARMDTRRTHDGGHTYRLKHSGTHRETFARP